VAYILQDSNYNSNIEARKNIHLPLVIKKSTQNGKCICRLCMIMFQDII